MTIYLTGGAVEKLLSGAVTNDKQMKPVLHVLRSRMSKPCTEGEKGILLLTDGGMHSIIGVLGVEDLTSLVKDKTIGPGSIIQLLNFQILDQPSQPAR